MGRCTIDRAIEDGSHARISAPFEVMAVHTVTVVVRPVAVDVEPVLVEGEVVSADDIVESSAMYSRRCAGAVALLARAARVRGISTFEG